MRRADKNRQNVLHGHIPLLEYSLEYTLRNMIKFDTHHNMSWNLFPNSILNYKAVMFYPLSPPEQSGR